ncbi:YfbU family protein [Lysinibacillus xylanilyticus]|uniref:YfbU family protein n=1 Tax=Lysinibacillus xylanilyticus TaxID=582475 RepID=UPI002E2328EB|nr:YfbU family protein [Lysinibacillus xylanilyticus]
MGKKFTLKERLILSNQYDLLAKLSEDDDSQKKHYENMSEIFRSGYSWGYGLATEPFSDELDEDECRFVLDVLNMYSNLYYSRQNCNEAQSEIEERKVLFKGFDLNDSQECKYLSFYRFLVEDFDRFNEFKSWIEEGKIEGFNSHGSGPSMEKLRRMLQKTKELNEIRFERHSRHFTKDEIEEILNA